MPREHSPAVASESAETRDSTDSERKPILVIGGSGGMTGRRVAQRLIARGIPVRNGSRSADPPFDWENRATWGPALSGVDAVYIAYSPDIAIPGAVDAIRELVAIAEDRGVRCLVLISGRGEEEAERAEEVVQASRIDSTIVRASWFAQNFSENFFVEGVMSGELAAPAGDVREPFVDVEDLADVVVAALTEDGHAGQRYELTGPRLLTFAEAVAEIANATGRDIRYTQIPQDDFISALEANGVPPVYVWLINYLFATVLDGRNESLTDGVQRVLGRAPRDFSEYARETAASGVWDAAMAGVAR